MRIWRLREGVVRCAGSVSIRTRRRTCVRRFGYRVCLQSNKTSRRNCTTFYAPDGTSLSSNKCLWMTLAVMSSTVWGRQVLDFSGQELDWINEHDKVCRTSMKVPEMEWISAFFGKGIPGKNIDSAVGQGGGHAYRKGS